MFLVRGNGIAMFFSFEIHSEIFAFKTIDPQIALNKDELRALGGCDR